MIEVAKKFTYVMVSSNYVVEHVGLVVIAPRSQSKHAEFEYRVRIIIPTFTIPTVFSWFLKCGLNKH